MEIVYHVVTERPMQKGQVLFFDAGHPNGVRARVDAFLRVKENRRKCDALEDFVTRDLERWSRVAYRELALEKVRREEFTQYPSRMACLYTSRTLREAQDWAKFFRDIGREPYSIVRLGVEGRVFSADAFLCFDGVEDETENLAPARSYWRRDAGGERPVIETLVDGRIEVLEIIEEYRK